MTININGLVIYYEKSGKGEPLILLHGNGEDHTIFENSILILEKQFTVYALDTRGHGQSDKVSEYHYKDMAEDVATFIKKLKLERPIICGFSDGAITALTVAFTYPSLVGMVISCGANTQPEGIKRRALTFMRLSYKVKHNPLLKLMLTEPDIREEDLAKIEVPVIVIAGKNDLIREKETRKIANSIKDSRLLILKGEDHGSYINHSQKLAYILLELIDSNKD